MDAPVTMGRWRLTPGMYRCPVNLIREDDGTFSAISANLPGAASRGDTVPDALANANEALAAVIESYLEAGQPIPWKAEPDPAPIGESWRAWVFPVVRPAREGR